MPELRLEIAALDYVFPAPARVCVMGESGGTLGRDERNTLVLPDRYRRVSRLHAEITFVRGVPILSNRSSTLAVSVGEQEVEPGDSAIVQDEDIIEVGPYLLSAHVHDERKAVPAPAAVAPLVERPPVTAESLLLSFLDGARLDKEGFGNALTLEQAELMGLMLRHIVHGTMDLLAARSITQREVRVATALISEQSNNPLVFLPSAEAALVQLLTGNLPGFMHGTRAMPDAFADLLAHEAGVMAGMRAALSEMLVRLDPRQVDESLQRTTPLGVQIAASSEKARWWDTQGERYAQVLTATEDNFQDAWGSVFVDAYAHAAECTRIQAMANLYASMSGASADPLVALAQQDASNEAVHGPATGESCLAS